MVLARQDFASEKEITDFGNSLSFQLQRFQPQPNLIADFLYRWQQVSNAVHKFSPTIILVTGNSRIVFLGYLLKQRYSIPCIAVGHGTEFGTHHLAKRALMLFVFNAVDCVVCVSEFTKNHMLKAGVQPKRTVVIPNGADETIFHLIDSPDVEQFRLQKGLDDQLVLVTVGHVSPRKGQDIVIQSLPEVIKEFPNITYIAIGIPTQAHVLENKVKELHLEKHVHFAGRLSVSELVFYLNLADLHLITSRHTSDGDFEGYGIVVIEAALCGTPSIVAGNSGLVEAVDYGDSGLIVPEDDPAATAQAILTLLKDRQQIRTLAARAYEQASNEKTWFKRVESYSALLNSLLRH